MLLEMKGICKDYQQGKEPVRVLSDVCLQVRQGDYVAIMGPSGSGKTTLMNLLGCLDVPTDGTYMFDGTQVTELRQNQLAQLRNEALGFVFQSFYLLPKLDAVENVALPLLYAGVPKKERRARAEQALKRMGLEDRLHFKPNQLSGGQCQRVAIARAIVTKPKLLLADEPTGALDSASGAQIMDIFDELNGQGVTIIMITHEREIADRAARLCHIRDGVLTGGLLSGCATEEALCPEDGQELRQTHAAQAVWTQEGETAPDAQLPEAVPQPEEDAWLQEDETSPDEQWTEIMLQSGESAPVAETQAEERDFDDFLKELLARRKDGEDNA